MIGQRGVRPGKRDSNQGERVSRFIEGSNEGQTMRHGRLIRKKKKKQNGVQVEMCITN